MAKAKKATPTPLATTPDRRALKAHEVLLSPIVQSAAAIEAWSKFAGEVDLGDLVDALRQQSSKVQSGNMQPVEAMLLGQAKALETIFTSLARRANSQEYLKHLQTYLALALKAQAQCRATLEALAEIKNPRPVLIAKQANVANGPQQVNNGAVPQGRESARAGQTESRHNGLLEAPDGIELDTGAQAAPGGTDPRLEAVGAFYGASHA